MVDVLIVVVCCAFARQNIFCLGFGETRKKRHSNIGRNS